MRCGMVKLREGYGRVRPRMRIGYPTTVPPPTANRNPHMQRLVLLALVALGFASRLTAADRPVPTKDAAARMTVPEGFRVSLFAGEPDVVQPIAMTFDD